MPANAARIIITSACLLLTCSVAIPQSQDPPVAPACGAAQISDDVQASGIAAFIGLRSSYAQSVMGLESLSYEELGGQPVMQPDVPMLAPVGQAPGTPPGIARTDSPGRIELAFTTPATAVSFDIELPGGDGCDTVRLRVINSAGAEILSRNSMRLDPQAPDQPIFVGLLAYDESIARVVLEARDAASQPAPFGIQALAVSFALVSIQAFYGDEAGFDAAAGSPPVLIDFDATPPGTDITNANIGGITLRRGNAPPPSAPLIVVRGSDTFTPAGFSGVSDPSTNVLTATSGENVLSPGGAELAPGFRPLVENDDLELIFDPPTSAVGMDILFQEFDCCSFVGVQVFDLCDQVILSQSTIPTNGPGGPVGVPGGSLFVGFAANEPVIARILIDEFDNNASFPDSNIGFDTIRSNVGTPEPLCDDVIVDAPQDACSAAASIDDGSFDPDGGSVTLEQNPPGPYVLGTTPVELMVTDNEGLQASCQATVTVMDRAGPVIELALEPLGQHDADDRKQNVRVTFNATDICDAAPQATGYLVMPGCPAVQIPNGQVISFKSGHGGCEIEVDDGILEVEGESLKLRVTAQDASGNGSSAEQTLGAAALAPSTMPRDERRLR